MHTRTRMLSALVVIAVAAAVGLPAGLAQRPDAPTYAQRGPFPVGTREYVIEDGAGEPLPATLWYPALNPDRVVEEVIYRVLLLGLPGRAIRNAAPDLDAGPYPLVVFSHGSGGMRYNSLWLTEHLASHGFVVIAADHPGNTILDSIRDPAAFGEAILSGIARRPTQALRALAFMDELAGPDGPLAGLVNLEQIAVAGHSFGGYTALSVGGARLDFDRLAAWCAAEGDFPAPPEGVPARDLSPDELAQLRNRSCFQAGAVWQTEHQSEGATSLIGISAVAEQVAELRGLAAAPGGLWPTTSDDRVRAVVALAPALGSLFGPDGLAALTVPALVLVGSGDTVTYPERDAYPIYQSLGSAEKALAVFEHAGHYVFIDACTEVMINFDLFWGCSDKVWDMARVHDLSNHLVTAFLLQALTGDADAAGALAPGAMDFPGLYYHATFSED